MPSPFWLQRQIRLKPRARGFHLVTAEILESLPELDALDVGLLHCFLQHTSASLMLTENADPTVRVDLEAHFNRCAAEGEAYYQHTLEGPDDMPAHLKSAHLGCSLTLPVSSGRLALGIWQGICLGEHRDAGGARTVLLTLSGQTV